MVCQSAGCVAFCSARDDLPQTVQGQGVSERGEMNLFRRADPTEGGVVGKSTKHGAGPDICVGAGKCRTIICRNFTKELFSVVRATRQR